MKSKKIILLVVVILIVCLLLGLFLFAFNKTKEDKNNEENINIESDSGENILINQEIVNNEELRIDAYITSLKNIYNNYILPDGLKLENAEDENYIMEQNLFAIHDVDFDGKEELIITLNNDPTVSKMFIIYKFDPITNTIKEKFIEFPSTTFYDNGVLEVGLSHNQGSAGDVLWPYTLYKYNKETENYEVIAQVDAWDKSFNEKCYIEDSFPEEMDKDEDGVIYYVKKNAEPDYKPFDLAEYSQWRSSYITEDTQKMEITYFAITEENINNIK